MSAHGWNYHSMKASDFWVFSSFLPSCSHIFSSSLLSTSRDVLLYHDVRTIFLTLLTAPRAKSLPPAKWNACLGRFLPTWPSFTPHLQPHIPPLWPRWPLPSAYPHCQPWKQGVRNLSSFFRSIPSIFLPEHHFLLILCPLWLLQFISSSHSPVKVLFRGSLRLRSPLETGSWTARWCQGR